MLLTRLRLSLSNLRGRKFKHSFQDSSNPICVSGTDVETTTHHLHHCPLFSGERLIRTNNIQNIDNNILNLISSRFSEVLLLFGNSSFNDTKTLPLTSFLLGFHVHWYLRTWWLYFFIMCKCVDKKTQKSTSTTMVTEMGHKQNTLSTFRLLMKLKRHFS